MQINNKDKSNIIVKSNVTLLSRGVLTPIDNMPNQYFDPRLRNVLTIEQSKMLEKMLFWAENIYDDYNNSVEDKCYKACQNCGEANNDCKRPLNKNKLKQI
jgi:hypothetical protein